MKDKSLLILVLILFGGSSVGGEQCEQLFGTEDSFSCICRDAACSTIGQVDSPQSGNYKIVSSSRDEFRFSITESPLDSSPSGSGNYTATIFVDVSAERQTMIGFGGAFTDASGINIATLDPTLQQTLIDHYFGPDGIEYTVARVPIAGTDFSTRPYSYNDEFGDVNLDTFALQMEDYTYKIPYIQMAQAASVRGVRLFASPWAPPYWMKTNQMVNGSGTLIPSMQQPWANYFIKFFKAYELESVNFWGLTPQNEPSTGLLPTFKWNTCGFTAEALREFIRDYLGPTLEASDYSDVQLMMPDDNRELFPFYPNTVLNDSIVDAYVQGIAVHWYADKIIPPLVVDQVHSQHPDKFFLNTEACNEPVLQQAGAAVKLGSWEYGENYAFSIIENSDHWSAGWVDWNLVLSMAGGPNWASNEVDSPIIVSDDGLEFYKQPMFYALGHFSKFIPYGSISLETTVEESDAKPRNGTVFSTAYITPSDDIVVVILSKNDDPEVLHISDSEGNSVSVTIPPRSIHTVIWAT